MNINQAYDSSCLIHKSTQGQDLGLSLARSFMNEDSQSKFISDVWQESHKDENFNKEERKCSPRFK